MPVTVSLRSGHGSWDSDDELVDLKHDYRSRSTSYRVNATAVVNDRNTLR